MKINRHLYELVQEQKPFDVQTLDTGEKVELFYVESEPVYKETCAIGRLANWATLDGKTYRLIVEKGYYEVMGELYDQKVNSIWIKFWNDLDSIKSKYTYRIMLPILIGFYALLVIAVIVLQNLGINDLGNYIIIGGVVVIFVLFFIGNKILNNKMYKMNNDAIEHIKKIKTKQVFDDLLEAQKKYMDTFYAKANAAEGNNEAVADENPAVEVEEVKEAVAEEVKPTPEVKKLEEKSVPEVKKPEEKKTTKGATSTSKTGTSTKKGSVKK